MTTNLVTLTTDFGWDSPYVAAMKGVILGINPSVYLVDLTHSIPPQDIRHTAFFLTGCVPYFPSDTLHVIVVDPGVGAGRAILYAETRNQRLLAPDNGCLDLLFRELGQPSVVRQVKESRLWRDCVSNTFHGRDIFAPVAGQLSRGVSSVILGPIVKDWVKLALPEPEATSSGIRGEIVFVDHFGNLITNIPENLITKSPNSLVLGRRTIKRFTWVRTYGEAEPGDLVVLISSFGYLELAAVQGNAANRLKAKVGTPIRVGLGELA